MYRNHRTTALVVGAATLLATVLTGCSTSSDDASTPGSTTGSTTSPTTGPTASAAPDQAAPPTPAPAPQPTDGKIQQVDATLFTTAWDLFANARIDQDAMSIIGAVATAQGQFKNAGQQAFALFALSSGNYRVGVLYVADDTAKKAFFDGTDIKTDGHPTKDAAIAELQPLLDAYPGVPLLDFAS